MVQRAKVYRTKTIYNSLMIFVMSHSIIVVNGQLLMHKKRNVYPLENEYRAADTSPTPVLQYFNSIVQLAYKMMHLVSFVVVHSRVMTYFWA